MLSILSTALTEWIGNYIMHILVFQKRPYFDNDGVVSVFGGDCALWSSCNEHLFAKCTMELGKKAQTINQSFLLV